VGLLLEWIGIKDGDKAKVLERLGFEIVGNGPDVRGDYLCTATPSGWLIIIANRKKFPLDEAAAGLSAEPVVLVGQYIEVVNYNTLREVRNGITAWSIIRHTDKARDSFIVEGDLPPQFADIQRRIQELEQEEHVDYLFDLPTELAQSICDYPFNEPDHSYDLLFRIGPIKPAEARQESLAEIFKSVVLPELGKRDWEINSDLPIGPYVVGVIRRREGQSQTLHFEVIEGPETRIVVKFGSNAGPVFGFVEQPKTKPPSLLGRLFGAKKPVVDVADQAIRSARTDILTAERFLETGDRSPDIRLTDEG
jgi:hypothetical protein